MEIIKRNCSLIEYNNCIGFEEAEQVLDQYNVDEDWYVYRVEGGVSIFIDQDLTKSLITFLPREKDNTVDVVSISLSKYVSNIYKAVSQFLTQYHIQNPFGLKNKKTLKLPNFLEDLGSYMSVVCESDEEIEETLEFHKKASKNNCSLRAKVGNFGYDHINGKVKIYGAAINHFFC